MCKEGLDNRNQAKSVSDKGEGLENNNWLQRFFTPTDNCADETQGQNIITNEPVHKFSYKSRAFQYLIDTLPSKFWQDTRYW